MTDKNKSFVWNLISTVFAVLLISAEIALGIKIYSLKILPFKYLILIFAFILILTAAVIFLLVYKSKKTYNNKINAKRITAYILSAVFSAVFIYGCFAAGKLNQTFDKITQAPETSSIVGIYVLKDDKAKTLKDAVNYKFGYTDSFAEDANRKVIENINKDLGKKAETVQFKDAFTMLDALNSRDLGAIIISTVYLDVLQETEEFSSFSESTRLLFEYKIEDSSVPQFSETAKPIKQNSIYDPFIMYLSGSDSRSKVLLSKNRSDVNILAVINPKTKQILLINTPRDYFIPNPAGNGALDKLTHCGIFGVSCSVKALSDLYKHPISYYAQINFTGFETMVDAVGGVTIYSDRDVPAGSERFTIKKGENFLDGEQALAYARNRYSYASGDNARGQHQMQVIKAIIDKMSSGAIVTNYYDILDSLQGMFTTNIPKDTISKYIKMQIENMSKWSVLSYAVTGRGGKDYPYSMVKSRAYVMYPNEKDVAKASNLMDKIMSGEILTQEEVNTME